MTKRAISSPLVSRRSKDRGRGPRSRPAVSTVVGTVTIALCLGLSYFIIARAFFSLATTSFGNFAYAKPSQVLDDPFFAGAVAPDVLAEFERARRFDVAASGLGMDVMNRLFSNDIPPLRAMRDLGLRLVDRTPALKRYFVEEADGARGSAPRLFLARTSAPLAINSSAMRI